MLKFVVKRKDLQNFIKDFEEKIKRSGIYLKTSRQITEGEEITIVFQFPEENVEIAGIGEVGWVDEDVDVSGRRGFLVRNIVLTPESLDIIERYRNTTYQQPTYTPPPSSTQTPQQTSPPPQQTPPPQPQQPPSSYQTGSYYNPPPPQQTPPLPPQQPPVQQTPPPQSQQPIPTANISVNVTSPTPQTSPPIPPSNIVLEEDLKKLRGRKSWIWIIILLLLIGAFGYWFLKMGGKEILLSQKENQEKKVEPTPPPQPQPQKVIIEVKQQEPKPAPKPKPPPPKPKPKPKPKKKRAIIKPVGLIDFVYDTGNNFTHLEFVFNKPYRKYIPSPLEDSLNIYIPHAYNATGQDQYFLSSSLVQSVVITKNGTTLSITIYPTTPSLPYYEFDRERERLIINFYKNP